MDCLYDIQQKDGCFFRETIASRANPETILYQKDVKRKADPLLIVFMNSFTSQDFDGHSIPAVFLKMLRHFQTNKLVQNAWKNGELNASFIQQWLSSDAWKEGLSEQDRTQQFFIWCILEIVLYPAIITERQVSTRHLKITQLIMKTDWIRHRKSVIVDSETSLRYYSNYLFGHITRYGMFWHFVNHQATTQLNGSYGLFPEKKVRFFCNRCLDFTFDSRRIDYNEEVVQGFGHHNNRKIDCRRWIQNYLSNGIPNPKFFCARLDEAYRCHVKLGDCFHVRSLLDILCLSLLYFAIYNVPIRQCSLCQQFYIPVKNQSGDMNFCHRNFNPKSNQTCSSYHSHNQKSILPDKEQSPAKALENSIGTIRSTFSQSNVSSFPNGRAWLDFLRDVVTIVSRTSRKDAQKIEQCSQILDRIKQLHKIMKTVKCCPEKDAPSLDPKTDDLENADTRLRVAEETVAAMLEKEKPDFPA